MHQTMSGWRNYVSAIISPRVLAHPPLPLTTIMSQITSGWRNYASAIVRHRVLARLPLAHLLAHPPLAMLMLQMLARQLHMFFPQ